MNYLNILKKQVRELEAEDKVEVLYSVDAGQITTGAKRNMLLEQAKGEWIVFIDADDWVADYYIYEMLKALESDCDCVAINGTYTCDGKNPIQWFLSKDNPNQTVNLNGKNVFLRTCNHITAVRRNLALKARFTDKKNAEDKDYSIALNPLLKTETIIHPPMYEYRYISTNKLYK